MQKSINNAGDERRLLAEYAGSRENAEELFKPRVDFQDITQCGLLLLDGLVPLTGTHWLVFQFEKLPDDSVANWGSRCWANTVSHLAETDPEVRHVLQAYQTYLPGNGPALELLIKKVISAWRFFIWTYASITTPPDSNNHYQIKIIVLKDVILLEGISAKRNGQAGGWGLLDKCLSDLEKIARAFGINRIKTIATNERVYKAMLRRGFKDYINPTNLERHIETYAKSLELFLSEKTTSNQPPHSTAS